MAKKKKPKKLKKLTLKQQLVAFMGWFSRPLLSRGLVFLFFAGVLLLLHPNQTSPAYPEPLFEVELKATPTDDQPLPPVVNPTIPPPEVAAKAVYVLDLASQTPLWSHNPDDRLLPASTTKIMTAFVSLQQYPLSDLVTITNAARSIGHTADLVYGETLTVEDLLYALMLSSGNDAAVALAQHHPEGYGGFLKSMNATAVELGLENTFFSNVSGIESGNHYSSARDLAILTQRALQIPIFKTIVSTREKVIVSTNGKFKHYLTNTNQLLGVIPGVEGIKTGWTPLAQECLVSYVTRDHHEILVVVLGSPDRFGESEKIIDWVYQSFTWD